MKVTIIGTLPPIKGISPYCTELLMALSKRVEVEFIGFKSIYPDFLYPGGTTFRDEKYEMPEIGNTSIRNILAWYNPLSWLWAGLTVRGDIVHAQWWAHPLAPVFFVTLFIAKLGGKKIIITVHNVQPHEKNRINTFLNNIVLRLGDSFIAHGGKNRESLSQIYNINQDEIAVIHHGILTPVTVRGITKEDARKFLNISSIKKVLLFFGNLRDYKGLDILLKAVMQIVKESENVILLIAGQSWEDWSKYQKIIDENKLEQYIIKKLDFIPPSEVEYYFSASDLVILPYKYFDSQSGVGALALPFKKPMVVTNVGGLSDFVKDKRAIAEPNDPQDLAEVVIEVFRDETLLLKLAKDSEELLEELNWDKIGEETIKMYDKFCLRR
ncbi:glycosyltransferase [Candidatus Methanoperedens nitroreducens]|uniref:Glycosyltransferase n=1 Tax=Candidatus Methanoperedens nitratireducens TaxID=1392998 RepID=A0A062V1V5_9EURY|nr:glycosyltransferase [Candidatus Methanoperedens nitroreducens]KCZ70613.1 glycosyltransferase [Candidatus Methanoperedens nitroreducens]MDJ1420469.1 glycosyltransferase [Candidatus Methanoperedens sp.]